MIKANNSLFEVVSFNLRVTDLFYLQTNINVCTSLSPVESKTRTEIYTKISNNQNSGPERGFLRE